MYCHTTHQLDKYQGNVDAAEAFNDAINARVSKIMEIGEEYDPFEVNNFSEGLSEISDKELVVIGGLLRLEKYEQSAKLLASHINDYWIKQAEKQAIRELSQ